jgi:hypothetical protein
VAAAPVAPSPVSDVLGTQQRPVALPNAGSAGSDRRSDAMLALAIVAAVTMGGGMLMMARRRR